MLSLHYVKRKVSDQKSDKNKRDRPAFMKYQIKDNQVCVAQILGKIIKISFLIISLISNFK